MLARVRPPVVAGMFYPEDPDECRAAARALLGEPVAGREGDSAVRAVGGIVPHAGWVCSGAIAGLTIRTLAQQHPAELVVVFGAVHTPLETSVAALDTHEAWAVPGAETQLDKNVTRQLTNASRLFEVDERLHRREHAIEVELPLIQAAWPQASLLPIEVPLVEDAVRIGKETAEAVGASGKRAVFLASSDLTHYGPAYRFTPAGLGREALQWARANDRRLLEKVTDLAAEQIVPEVKAHLNACGGGAIAAMLSACREMGATRANVLRHANSSEILAGLLPRASVDAVGYAAVVVT